MWLVLCVPIKGSATESAFIQVLYLSTGFSTLQIKILLNLKIYSMNNIYNILQTLFRNHDSTTESADGCIFTSPHRSCFWCGWFFCLKKKTSLGCNFSVHTFVCRSTLKYSKGFHKQCLTRNLLQPSRGCNFLSLNLLQPLPPFLLSPQAKHIYVEGW